MIRYLGNASNEIEYTTAKGDLIRRNPFDTEFVLIAQRLSLIHSNDAENQIRRNNYERAVKDAQISIDAGRQAFLGVQLQFPLHINTPEDFHDPVDEDMNWDPPLLVLKPQPTATAPNTGGFGPDAPGRHPVVTAVDNMPLAAQNSLQSVLALLGAAGPTLPLLIDLLESMLNHHGNATK